MEFRTTPFPHQLAELELSRDLATRAIFWEMGCGKSKVVLDTAAYLCEKKEIDGLLILAPNGVAGNWILDEIPTHLAVPCRSHSWSTGSAATKWHAKEVKELLAHQGLAVLAMSYDAFRTHLGRRAAEAFLDKRRCLYVCDESQRIKTPGAKRTISVVASGRRAAYKRILSGTPITNKPFDIYSQLKFLDEDFWVKRGFASYEAFKCHFGVWVSRVNGSTGGRFEQVVSFKNLTHLGDIVSEVGTRLLKTDVLDLPPKIYTKRYHDLSGEQRRVYDELRSEFIAELDGGTMTAPQMITRLLRLQQVTCGYAVDDLGEVRAFPENPRLKLLAEVIEDLDGQAIIFARFRHDVSAICALLGADAVRYDGETSEDERLAARRAFQAGTTRFFVGNPAAAGVGLTLTAASTVIYFSNSFNLEDRLQSEDRAHRIGQTRAVTYIDLVANGTVDTRIVSTLRKKLDVASLVTGDAVREWL